MSKKSQADGNGKLKNKDYMKELRQRQEKLGMLQEWVKPKGLRAIITFEGRDAAGKDGTNRTPTAQTNLNSASATCLPRRLSRTINDLRHEMVPLQ